jgi:serine/threonine-protein kinase HipA
MVASAREVAMAWQISKAGRLDRLIVFLFLPDGPVPIGELVSEGVKTRQSLFRYARSWIANPAKFDIAPAGFPVRAGVYKSSPFEVPLPFYDAAPDGWGKGLLRAAFPNQFFGMAEYLAAAGEERTGALGFGPEPESGPARWEPERPLVQLATGAETLEELQAAAEAVDSGNATQSQLTLLFRTSADAGGARPKARVRLDGEERIAKFSTWGDPFDDPKIEAVSLSLAKACGIAVPEHDLRTVAGRSVLLVKRFDRSDTGLRYPYISAATLLGQDPNEYATGFSYVDMAVKARRVGVRPCEQEIFRRLLFNCFIHNTDDHLRNFAFVRVNGDWQLSPAFDLVPNRSERLVLRPAAGIDPLPDPAAAFRAHADLGLSQADARSIYDEIVAGLKALPAILDRLEVTARDRDTIEGLMPFAFARPSAPWGVDCITSRVR